MKALSIRQPWAWFILCGYPWAKDVENRDWYPPKEMIGRNFQIHAAKTMPQSEFDAACRFAQKAGATMFPDPERLRRGGLVGIVKLARVVRVSSSPWFVGKYGWCLEDAYPLPFLPCLGQQGFFEPQVL